MEYNEIQKRALAEWQKLTTSDKPKIYIGYGTCGKAAGGEAVEKAIRQELSKQGKEALIIEVGCIGLCFAEPLVDIEKPGRPRISYKNVTPETAVQLVQDYIVNDNPRPDLAFGSIGEGKVEGIPNLFDLPVLKPQVRIVLRNCGFIDPANMNHAIAKGAYSGLAKALKMTPEAVLEEVRKSGLRGRGGAGFSTAQKWEFCRKSPGTEKYVICNADEGDPGAFMNRSLLEGDPHSVLEGIAIGCYTIGAHQAYIYCRAEKAGALESIKRAVEQMREYGFIGENVMGSGFNLDIEVREGAGAFVCGEETALMASIEGKRGMPRARPPFPAVSGLWGKPTNINNVETWADVALILQKGSPWYAAYGATKNSGTKTFSLVGKIERTGLIEVPLGMKLRQIIFDIGGGIAKGRPFKAVQTGGPSGGCLPATMLDLTIDYESLASAGSIMGSGGMIVMDDNSCVVDLARYFLGFVQAESCGKCTFCRVGTRRMLEILQRITQGKGKTGDIDLLGELARQIKDGSLCGLGQTAPNPVLTTIRYFRDEYEAHINEKRCPARVCKDLINFYVLPDKCAGCQICLRACPVGAIAGGKRMVHVIDQQKCVKCGTCVEVCPARFSAAVKVSGEKIEVPAAPVPIASKS